MAVREKDFAAAVIGVQSFYYKLVAFATSSFIGGVSGAMLIFTFYLLINLLFAGIYFAIWITLTTILTRWSRSQDESAPFST